MADDKKKAGGKGGKDAKAKEPSKRLLYKVENGHVVRSRRACPKCGPGVFLAEHKDRASCGNCAYTEMKQAATVR